MPDELQISSRPELERPILIAAFRGWNDGGQGASLATGYLAKLWEAERFAEIDPENFFDFQATRPHVSLEEGLTRRIDWPATVFYHGRPPGFDRDVVLLLGIEPNLRWRTFTDMIVDFAEASSASTSSSRSARCWPTCRTRGPARSRAARATELVERLGLSASRYEGPTGIVGVLHDACRRAGISRRQASGPRSRTTSRSRRARRRRSRSASGSPTCSRPRSTRASWPRPSENYSEQVSEAVASDPDTAAYIEELEQRADTLAEEADLPSGDALAAELTRFLRERESARTASPTSPGAVSTASRT